MYNNIYVLLFSKSIFEIYIDLKITTIELQMVKGEFASGVGGWNRVYRSTEYHNAYYHQNIEHIKQRRKKAYDANPEYFREKARLSRIKAKIKKQQKE
tara:strand:+ start:419 stop:712 length:294 start_codon:yes stop_codon:yes gene_type:complete